jgi:hypothetical protein
MKVTTLLPSPSSQHNHNKGTSYHFVAAKPSKKVTEAVVSFFFATIEPHNKIVAHCHHLLSSNNTKTKGDRSCCHLCYNKKKATTAFLFALQQNKKR